MKLLLGILLVLGLAMTGTAFAASMPDFTVKKLGSKGIEMVTGPSSTPPGIGWTLTGGQIDGSNITWPPKSSGSFNVKMEINDGGPEGSANVSGTQGVQRTDLISLSPTIASASVSTIEIVIAEN